MAACIVAHTGTIEEKRVDIVILLDFSQEGDFHLQPIARRDRLNVPMKQMK